jgi:NADPH-dependent curcumin reductase CurA
MALNKRFLLMKRPVGMPKPSDFELRSEPLPTLQPGQFLIRNHYCSLDPAQRGWMDDAPSYMPPIPLGAPVRATTIGVVHDSATPDFTPGQWVLGLNAIEEYSLSQSGGFTAPVDVSIVPSPTNFLSILGAVGLTAYFAMTDVTPAKPGQTVLVSGAAGAVGSVVGQIAKIQSARAVGIAGGPDKCAKLLKDYKFDAAIDYRGKDLAAMTDAIKQACPAGVDIFFDNVGGVILDAALANLNEHATALLCGLISQYNNADPTPGPTNLWQLIVKQANIRGFLVRDYVARFGEGAVAMAKWLGEGKIHFEEHIEEGIDNALPAFLKLFSGQNTGKLILKVA